MTIEKGNLMLPSLVDPGVINAMINRAKQTPPGIFVEVGVYKGGTAWHLCKLAKQQNRKIYLYDTFEGIPYKDPVDSHKIGDFKNTSYEKIVKELPYATVVKGIFPDSAVEMEDISFVHFDCDQYKSIIDGVSYLRSKMIKGGVMWFDDYAVLKGATKAIYELFSKEQINIDYTKAYVVF